MKVLLAYAVSPRAWESFLAAQEVQHSRFPFAVAGYERFVVGGEFAAREEFNLARARNRSLDYAVQTDADWVILLDADAVLTAPIQNFPSSGFGSATIYRTQDGETEYELDNAEKWGPSSWFILRRDLFKRHRYSEEYRGYGYEDNDFDRVVMANAGVLQSNCDLRALHVWHPARSYLGNMERNREHFEARQIKKRLLFRGYLDTAGGYGHYTINVIEGLIERGYDVEIWPLGISEPHAKLNDSIRSRIVSSTDAPAQFAIALPNADLNHARIRTVFQSTWETTRLKRGVVANLNQAEAVIVPCDWNANCFSASGVDRPIYRVPHFFNFDLYPERPLPAMDTLVFGTAGTNHWNTSRKRLEVILEAFREAFPTEKDVALNIKSLGQDLLGSAPRDPRIHVLHGYLSQRRMSLWYSDLHVYACVPAAEGWGLMPHQAMAVGRPLLTTRYSGTSEYFDESVGWEVEYGYAPPELFYAGGGVWSQADTEDLIAKFRHIYQSRWEIEPKGHAAAQRARKFTKDRSIDALIKVLEKHEIFY